MSTIPTLIVAPAIIAAGIAYKYGGGGHRRRSVSSMRSNGDDIGHQRRMSVPTLIPHSSFTKDQKRSLSKIQGVSNGPIELTQEEVHASYPYTTEGIDNSSWMYKAAHHITGDLGPIEHQDQEPSADGRLHQVSDGQQDIGPGASALDSSSTRPIHEAGRAADKVLEEQSYRNRDTDVNRAALDATRSGSSNWIPWSASSTEMSKDANTNKGQNEGDARSWFWNRKQEVDDKANQIMDDTKQKAEDTKGWFWNKKEEAEETTSQKMKDTKGWVQDKKQATDDKANQVADDTKDWFWNAKEEADQAVQGAKGWFGSQMQDMEDGGVGEVSNKQQDVNVGDKLQQQRRDSLMSENKMDEARSTLRSTAQDLKNMVGSNKGGEPAEFVERDSHIPMVSSSKD